MSQCVFLQPDGTVIATPASPSECTGYVLLTREEYSNVMNPFFQHLDMVQGVKIGGAIVAVWVLAFCFRSIGGVFHDNSGDSNL